MGRKALVVGIDHYETLAPLTGAVNDARSVAKLLEQHEDESPNFDVRLVVGTDATDSVQRRELREAIDELFDDDGGIEVALLYFAGHGHLEETGGYLCAGDCRMGNDGLALAEIMTMAHKSKAQNKIIVLDSCHGGIAGTHPVYSAMTEISDGMTIMTASTAGQYASESNGSGLFTTLLVDALAGGAANLVGEITPAAVYAHVDQSLGTWVKQQQRPVYKTNTKRFVSLRRVRPPLDLVELRRIFEFFPETGDRYRLDPSFESVRQLPSDIPLPDPEKTKIFAILQKYNRVGLLVPEGAPHMWHAAMESKPVRLTALGEHYRRLVANKRI